VTLENRFKQFMASLSGVESVDALLPPGSFVGKQRADYLVANRRVVLELKTLKVDPSAKIEAELSQHRNRDDFPLIYGSVELPKILRHLPDSDQINQRIYRNISRSVETAVRGAETQISDTEEIFNLLKPVGLLVLLNESIDVLDPKVVVRKTSELLTRERTDGSMHTSIDFVWLLFEGHAIETIDSATARPSILLEGPTANSFDWFIPEFNQIQIAWSVFNNTPLRHASVEQIADMPFRSTKSDHATPPEKLKQQEIWECRYNASPYLRHFNDSDVIDHGTKVYQLLLPYFLKDGPRIPMEQLEPLFIKWSDFLQESRHRELNLRHLQDRL
jgi:hypothetical protein